MRALGPDSLNASFYQQNWVIVGASIIIKVKHLFEKWIFPMSEIIQIYA